MPADQYGPTVLPGPFPLTCDGKRHPIDFPRFAPPMSTSMDAHIYVHVAGVRVPHREWHCPTCNEGLMIPGRGKLRIRMVREAWGGEGADGTYLFDLDLWDGESRAETRSMFEEADGGRGLRWEYEVWGATAAVLKTHYVKYRAVT